MGCGASKEMNVEEVDSRTGSRRSDGISDQETRRTSLTNTSTKSPRGSKSNGILALPSRFNNSKRRSSKKPNIPKSLAELYKLFGYKHAQELLAAGTYPVYDIWEHFSRGNLLGKGGYGEVTVVKKKPADLVEAPLDIKEIPDTSTEFAMKSINQLRKEKDTFPAFENEVRVHKMLKSQNIVNYIASFVSLDQYHLVTELSTGGEVFDRIVSLKRFSERVASVVVRQMLLGLQHCHDSNVVHRDLKPSNFVFDSNEIDLTKSVVKLIDFGLAKHIDPETVYSDKVGTPFYVSPETIDAQHEYYNKRTGSILKSCDMWAMGAIVFVLVTGKLPFPGKKHKDIFRNISKRRFRFPDTILLSDSVRDFITKLLDLDPMKRLSCAQALKHPWISNRDVNASSTPLDSTVLLSLSRFQTKNKLQKAVARVAVNFLTDTDIKMLQDLFAKYDKSRTGTLEITELILMLKDNGFDADAAEAEARNLMEDLDTNRTGHLSMVEFAQVAARNRVSVGNHTIAKKTFEAMDLEGAGHITPDLMKQHFGEDMDDSYIERIFRKIDREGKGVLTFEQFLEAMRVTMRTVREAKKKTRSSLFELSFKKDEVIPLSIPSAIDDLDEKM